MADATPQLQEAYELIEAGDLESARQILDEIRADNENNPDFWWIYAHAVEDEAEGMGALERVGQLAPNYPGLQTLSETLGIRTPQPVQTQKPPAPLTPSTADVDAFADEFDGVPAGAESGGSNNFITYAIFAIVVVIVIGGLYAVYNVMNSGEPDPAPTDIMGNIDPSPEPVIPTAVAEAATDEAEMETQTDAPAEATPVEETVAPQPTVEPATETPEISADPFAPVYADLETFGVSEGSITTSVTEAFGETYVVITCSQLGPIATQNILGIADTLGTVAGALSEDVSGFVFDITDCETDTIRLALGVDRDTMESYWAGEITQPQLQQALQRVN